MFSWLRNLFSSAEPVVETPIAKPEPVKTTQAKKPAAKPAAKKATVKKADLSKNISSLSPFTIDVTPVI